MRESDLAPGLREALQSLVEAAARSGPSSRPFLCMEDYGDGRRRAMIMHPGWLEDSPEVHIYDLDALEEAGLIRRRSRGIGFEFQLTTRAILLHEANLHPEDTEYRTRIAMTIRLTDKDLLEVCTEDRTTSLTPRVGQVFLFLVLASIQGNGGWVHQRQLIDEKLVTESGATQGLARLRRALAELLGSIDPKNFVEASGDGRIRISTPPRLLKYDIASLARSTDRVVAALAERLRSLP